MVRTGVFRDSPFAWREKVTEERWEARTGPREWIGNVMLVAIRPRSAKLIQQSRRKCGDELRGDDVSAILKVRRRAKSIKTSNVCVEGVPITKVVITNEKLVFTIDTPVGAKVDPLGILDRAGSCEVRGTDSKRFKGRLCGRCDRVGGGIRTLEVFISYKKEEFVLENGAAYVTDEVIDMQTGFDDATGRIGIAVVEDGAGTCCFGAPDILCEPVKGIGPGVGDAVVDDAGCVAELRGKTVGHRVDLFNIGVRDGEEAKTIAIALCVYHAIELIIHAINQPVGVERTGDAVLGIRMAADAGLKEDEVIGVSRSQGKILGFLGANGATKIEA